MKVILFGLVMMLCTQAAKSQAVFDYYISNNGNDTSAGTSALHPKKTVSGVMSLLQSGSLPAQPLKIGFRNGDVFNENIAPGFPVRASSYSLNGGSKKFAILNGSNSFDTGWARADSTLNIYEQSFALEGYTGYGIGVIGQYSFVTVFEIDRELERTAPITARKLLKFCNSKALADETPGSFYEPASENVNSLKISVHTSDGSSPNNHPKYRYEVTVRGKAFNSTYQQNNQFERLWVRGYGAGVGMIPAGANSSFNRMILGPAAGIHHLVLRGATINNSLFLPAAANTSVYAVVFYDVEGFGRHNSIKNSIFLDLRYPMYSHHSNGSSFGAFELDNVIAFADTTEGISFMEVANTDSAILNNVYAYGFNNGYNYGHTPYFFAKNSSFVDVVNGISFGSENKLANINNCFVKTRGNNRSVGILMNNSNKVILSNSVVHLRNYNRTGSTAYAGVFVDGAGLPTNNIGATGNIFIADVEPLKNVLAASGTGVSGSNWQNNVYVLLRGNKIEWRVSKDNSPNSPVSVVSFEEWQRRTGKDSKSLFFDLRKDPRGLKAIFVDPDNGDYSIANTFEGNRIRALRAGMINPINCFLKKPTYEEAASVIMNDGVLAANVCRSPCVQNSIRISHDFTESAPGGKRIQLQWNMAGEQGIERYEIQRSSGNSDFINIGFKNNSGTGSYSFIDSNVQVGVTYNYSLVVVTKAGEKCYSQIRSIALKDNKPMNIYPNPSPGLFMVSLPGYTGKVSVSVTNITGIKVLTKEINNIYGVPLKVDLSGNSKGMYFIKLQAGNDSYFESIMVK